jgi:hypothetical protein
MQKPENLSEKQSEVVLYIYNPQSFLQTVKILQRQLLRAQLVI